MVSRAFIDPIRSLGFAGISGAYATVGTALTKPARIFILTNNTQGDVFFTDDQSDDKLFVGAGSFKLIDVQANMNPVNDDQYVLPTGTQFSVKQITAPVSGAVYLEIIN